MGTLLELFLVADAFVPTGCPLIIRPVDLSVVGRPGTILVAPPANDSLDDLLRSLVSFMSALKSVVVDILFLIVCSMDFLRRLPEEGLLDL